MMRYMFDMYKMRLSRRKKHIAWLFLCVWTYFLISDIVNGYIFFAALVSLFALENLYCVTHGD